MSRGASRQWSAFWRGSEPRALPEAPRGAGGRRCRCRGPQLAGGGLAGRAPGARARLAGGVRCGLGLGYRCRGGRRRTLAGGGRRRTLGLAPAAEACAALRRRPEQRPALLERARLRVAVLRYLGVLLAIRDVRAVAAVEHLDTLGGEVLGDAIGIRPLLQAHHP